MSAVPVSSTINLSNDDSLLEQISSEKKMSESKKSLRKKLKIYRSENDELHDTVQKKDEEIIELNKKITSLNDLINSSQISDLGRGSSIASSKIFELSKKNRQLTAELHASKSRCNKINVNYTKLQKEFEQYKEKYSLQNIVKKRPCCESAGQLESLKDQLNSTKQKLFETLNSNNKLKNDLKLAQKCIQQEIGEDFNLSILASAYPTWRGRSQQILALQKKVSELKQRLDIGSVKSSKSSIHKFGYPLKRMESYRKVEMEELQVQINVLKSTVEEQKQKISALKTRNKNLTDETMNYKLKTLNLMEQTGNSDNSIQALQEQMNIQKYMYENKIASLNKEIEHLKNIKNDIEEQNQRIQDKVKNMKAAIDAKQNEIDDLNTTIKKLENDLRSVCGDFLFSCRDLRKEEYVAILDALETEKIGLVKRNQILSKRLDEEREKVENLNEQISKLKIKCARQDAKLKELQKYQETQLEKKKRSQRIAGFTQSLNNIKIPTIVVENTNSCYDFNQDLCNSTTTLTSQSQQIDKFENIDLKQKLELAGEKISFLEDKINHLTNEKEMDTKIFSEIMNNSKNILLNIIQNNKNNNCLDTAIQTENDQEQKKQQQQQKQKVVNCCHFEGCNCMSSQQFKSSATF